MIPEELESAKVRGISRRRMIKRIGTGAAIAWSAPILTSIATPAFAQYSCCCFDSGCPEQNFQPCTNDPSGCETGACTGGLGCFKGYDTEGECNCLQNIFCSCVQACISSGDCGPRQHCIENTGCGPGGVCLDCCGEGCRDSSSGKRPRGAKVVG